jgi:hypothetical protein
MARQREGGGSGRPAAPAKPRAIGYLRVSTNVQADHGMGLVVQRERVEAHARENELD